MSRRIRPFVCLVVLGLVISLCPVSGSWYTTVLWPDAPARDTFLADADPAGAAAQVRLRKLHLVRPDLIPYPIAFEVYA